MITKRTRVLSFVATLLMLVSMLACFVIPASAEISAELQAAYDMYSAIAKDATGDDALEAAVADMKAVIDGTVTEYVEADLISAASAAIADGGLSFGEEVKPRVAWTKAYTTAGYTGSNWSISLAEDWLAMVSGDGNANALSQAKVHSYYVTADIEFNNTQMLPISCFRGNIYGQNHTFMNVNIVQKGAGTTNNNGAALASRTGAGAAGDQVIQDLGVTGKVTSTVNNGAANAVYAATFVCSNENVTFSNCWSSAEINFTNSGTASGLVYVGGIVAYSNKPITGCTYSGTMKTNSVSSGNDFIGGIVGYANGAGVNVTKCAFTGVIQDTGTMSANGEEGVGGIVGRTVGGAPVDNCYSIGTISSATGSATGLVASVNRAGKIYNSISAANITAPAGYAAAFKEHSNAFSTGVSVWSAFNVYAVGHNFVCVRGTNTSSETYNGHGYNLEGFNGSELYKATSAAEAAWKVMNGYTAGTGSQVYYTLDENDVIAFSAQADGSDRIRKISVSGDAEGTLYAVPGDVISIVDDLELQASGTGITYAVSNATTGDPIAFENDVFTVPEGDVSVVADYDPAAQLAAAKEELQEVINKYADIKEALLTEVSAAALTTFKTNASNAMNSEDKSVVEAAIAEGNGLSIVLENSYPNIPQFKDYAIYDPYNAANKWLIAEKEDWTDAVDMGTAADVLSAEFHLANDIDMQGSTTAAIYPLGYGGVFNGKIYGHGKNFVDVNITNKDNTDKGTALISNAGNATFDQLGIASGKVISKASTSYGGYTGAFIGQISGTVSVTKCWNGADVTAESTNANSIAGALAGWGGHTSYSAILSVNGFYNLGDITATGTAAALHAGTVSHGHKGNYNVFNAGTLTAADVRLTSYHFTSENAVLNYAVENEDYAVRVHYAQPAADKLSDAIIADYATGEMGYKLNQGRIALGENAKYAAAAPIYWTLKDGKTTFGADDGSDQIRKITFEGAYEGVKYINAGSALDLDDIISEATFEITTTGAASTKDEGNVLTLANEDITINVVSENVAPEALAAAKAVLEKYAAIDASIFSNDDLQAKIDEVKAMLTVLAGEPTNDQKKEALDLAEEVEGINLTLAEGKKVPFAEKDGLCKDIDANGEYGIYTVEDWNAFATGSRSGKVYLMNNLTLPADAENLAGASLNCTFDGQGNTLTVNATLNLTSGCHTGFFGKGNTIQNLTVAGNFQINIGTVETPVTGNNYVGAITGSATMTSVINEAAVNIKAYGTTGATRLYVGALVGSVGVLTNCTNNGAITAEGYAGNFAVGGIGGRNNEGVANNTNLLNTGAITVIDASAEGEYRVYAGGIFGNTAGNSMKNVKNTGDIKVIGGREVYVGGIQAAGTETNANYIDGAVNEGKIEVTPNEGATVYAAGIMGFNSWPMMGTISNSGDIIVDAKNAAKVHIAGIAAEFSTHALTNVSAEGLVNTEITATNTGKVWLGGIKEASAAHTVAQITADFQTIGDKTVALKACTESGTAAVCEHNSGSSDPVTETTHANACADCSFVEIVDCTYDAEIKHTTEATYDADTLTAKHTAVCGCGHEKEADCASTKHPATCEEDLYFTFTCGRDMVTIADTALGHDFVGAAWNDDEDPAKEYQKCQRDGCDAKNYRLKGSVAAEGIAMNANKEDGVITITLPELTAGKITLTLEGAGYTIKDVTGAAATAEENVFTYEGTEIKVTIKSAKDVIADGTLKVALTEAAKGEEDVSDAEAEVTIRFVAIDGDADASGNLTLGDALATLYYVVGDDAYKAAHPINTYNANLYYEGGSRDDGIINVQDAHAVVKLWLQTAEF